MDLSGLTSIILALLTALYVFLTWRLNVNAERSATSAETSATASKDATQAARETAEASLRAAEAAERSAASSEAAIPVDFSIVSIVTTGSRTVVNIRSETVNVYIFSIYVRLLVIPASHGGIREVSSTTRMTNDEGQHVIHVHKGDETFAALPERINAGDTVFGNAVVVYGFAPEPAGREKPVNIPNQHVMHVADRSV
jgi:hypothetical protein